MTVQSTKYKAEFPQDCHGGETKVLDQLKYAVVSDVITFSSLEGDEVYTGKFSNDRTSFIVVEGEDSVEFVKQTRQAESGSREVLTPGSHIPGRTDP